MVEQETTIPYTAISRKVVGKSASDNPERYYGGFEFTVLQRNLKEWHERPWTYTCFKKKVSERRADGNCRTEIVRPKGTVGFEY